MTNEMKTAEARLIKAQEELKAAEVNIFSIGCRYDLTPDPRKGRAYDTPVEHPEFIHSDRVRDVFEVQDEGDSLVVHSGADEIFVTIGDGCSLNIHGHTGIVHIESGDGSVVIFEKKVGGANVSQGSGSQATFLKRLDTVTIDQGAGSEVLTVS